jgi:hypothetical protein
MGEPAFNLERQFEESYKVIDSFLYFVLNYVQIEDKETSRAIPFALWQSQLDIMPQIISPDWLIIIKARQLGLTWIMAAYCLWLSITRPLQQILVVSYNQDVAQEFVARIRFMLARLPDWMLPSLKRDTTEILEFGHLDPAGKPINSLIQSLPTTPKGGQSKTPTLLVCDESALNQYFKEIYGATEPGIDAAGGRVVVISNAMKQAPGWSFTRELYVNSMQGLNTFQRIFIPWWGRPGRPTEKVWDEYEKKEIPKFIYIQKYEKNKDDETIIEHYPATEEEAISVVGGSYFGRVLGKHSDNQINGNVCDIKRNKDKDIEIVKNRRGILEIWRYPYRQLMGWDELQWSNRYCIGSDVSEGLGQSYSVAYVIDRVLDEIVARLRSNRVDAYEWANLLYLLSCYYDNALICTERTGAGQTTVKRLAELEANQYIQLTPDSVGGQMTKKYGWHESQQSKHELCGDLKTWLRTMKGKLYCPILLDECSTWIRHDGGKLGPEQGKLGDCVMGAGCTVEADIFLGEKPVKEIKDTDYEWQKQLKRSGESNWAL